MTPFGLLVRAITPHGLVSLGDQLVVHQCHHHALFLDQTVADALGGEGRAVRRQASFEAAHAMLGSFCAQLGVVSPAERLELAAELFNATGHGRLGLDLTAEGGTARGRELFFGACFAEKYAGVLAHRRPLDTFAAGFLSAAASLAFPSDWGTVEADETACVAQTSTRVPGHDGAAGGPKPRAGDAGTECVFSLRRRPEGPRFGAVVTRALVEQIPVPFPESDADRPSAEADRAAGDLSRLLQALPAGEDGALRAFGVRLALVPVSYTGQITFDTVHLVEKRAPELFPLVGTLVREAAAMGAFHLLGGVLASEAWREEHGPPPADAEARLHELVGMARALGWGAFYPAELAPGRRLVLRAPITHESAYYAVRHGPTVRSRLFVQQGLALALMQLLHRVDFTAERPIAPETYDALFKSGTRFHVEETSSTLRGDRTCEVVVEAMAER